MGAEPVHRHVSQADACARPREVAPSASGSSWLADQIAQFARFGAEEGGGVTRLAYSDADVQARRWFLRLCREMDLDVRIDPVGNIIARRPGLAPDLPAVAMGSHLDTVIRGGHYDGVLGVVAALDVIRRLQQRRIQTVHPLEVMVFAAEESTRFGVATIGSKAMAGLLDADRAAGWRDREGRTFAEVLAARGLDLRAAPSARRTEGELRAFLELHIEQGPELEASGFQIGVVHAIAAPTRLRVRVEGTPGHSGTTPMTLRQDALAAAAEVVLAVERLARAETEHRSVGTVGVLQAEPGSPNTIPGRVEMVAEFRSVDAEAKRKLVAQLMHEIHEIEHARGVRAEVEVLSDESPVRLDGDIRRCIARVCAGRGIRWQEMASGAGHDAMNMARLCPAGLVFIPCRDGISHHPDEYARERDMQTGVDVLLDTVLALAGARQEGQP
ncbi:M20 family metallo-hydrolase [Alicyclobacillus macrosporangiidus]|uniref:M20 family metallo-hydrolase n=1 Tax=Alicyclobacillus macrosporangiidus TaxID=392015 RepID=UPI000689C34E|nr:M20 family metallo-hydrolase [Alicyclobacillus macrosporangiidus]